MNTLTGLLVALKLLTGLGQSEIAKPAWVLLKAGRIDEAAAAARDALPEDDSGELLHVLFDIEFLRGNYESALSLYEKIPENYYRYASFDEFVVHAYRHLGRYQDALDFAKNRKRSASEIAILDKLAAQPFSAVLDGLTIVPFADHPLSPYFPAFNAAVNGLDVVAHVDTGGNYLIMGPERANALGIEVREAGSGFHGARAVPMSLGVADSMRLGDAMLQNVPVTVLASLTGPQDFVIFGTNILQPFLSTLDYPNNRLILSPRADAESARAHMAMLPNPRHEVPFYMWSDHYMIAPGSVGDRPAWFFVDSGLVLIQPWQGSQKQVALSASKAQYQSLGLDAAHIQSPPFAFPAAIGLAGLPQQGHIGTVSNACPTELGGVKIDGLLSHAYLKHYAWTLDFDRRIYIFSESASSAD
jgi:hypothetical protein